MSAPTPSQLDFSQCIQGAYDDAKGRIRVEGEATIVNGALEVAISSVTDNIAIRNTSNGYELKINSDGSINTVTTFSGSIVATNPSVGLTGATAPTSATEMGAVDASGKLQSLQVDPSGKLLVDITGTSVVTGTVNSNLQGLNNFQTSQYTIGLTAVQLAPVPLTGRSAITIRIDKNNLGTVYIGNSNAVTTSNGYPLFAGDTLGMDLTDSKTIYAIADTANQKLAVLEIG